MCLVKDFGEWFAVDIPIFNKTDFDRNIEDVVLWLDIIMNKSADITNKKWIRK
ncbi:MAG: hypothetical protein K6E98_02140 [Lachnospiraceae bacterium]|nr:hypothetical protein [Lachnospiraceae bacterium]